MSRQTRALGVAIALVVVSVGAWVGLRGEAAPAARAAKGQPVLSVSVVAPEQRTLDDDIRVTGAVVPREDVVVVAELAGRRVRAVHAEAGDQVKRGQPLAELDGESLSIQSESLQTELARAREEYERANKLHQAGALSDELVKQRQAAFEVARSRLRDSQLHMNKAQIVAPADGIIYERNATIGGLAGGSEPLFRIAMSGKLEVEVRVPEDLVRRLRPGVPATLKVAGDSAPAAGSVRLIMGQVDAASRTVGVRISSERELVAPVGAFCEASITVAKVGGWIVPGTALLRDARGTYVWQVGPENVVARRPVTVLLRTASRAVIQEPLEGTRIVARAGAFLREGDLIAVAKE